MDPSVLNLKVGKVYLNHEGFPPQRLRIRAPGVTFDADIDPFRRTLSNVDVVGEGVAPDETSLGDLATEIAREWLTRNKRRREEWFSEHVHQKWVSAVPAPRDHIGLEVFILRGDVSVHLFAGTDAHGHPTHTLAQHGQRVQLTSEQYEQLRSLMTNEHFAYLDTAPDD